MPRFHGLSYAALAGLLATLFLWAGSAQTQHRESAFPGPYQTEAYQRTSSHVRPPETGRRNIQPEAMQGLCNNPLDRDEHDLCQQWRMAEAAETQARATIAQVILTIAEIGALLWVVTLTVKATNAAVRANEIAQGTAKHQLRAYVLVDEASVTWESGFKVAVRVTIKNFGQTPAKKMRAWLVLGGAEETEFADHPPAFTRQSDSVNDLGPGDVYYITCTTDPLPEDEWRAIRARSKPFYAWGKVTYDDIFEEVERYSRFRLTLPMGPHANSSDAAFTACAEGNESN